MPYSVLDIAEARTMLDALLEELRLDAYLFEIEPMDDQWELRVECAIEEGWEIVTMPLSRAALLASRSDPSVRQRLLATLGKELTRCKARPRAETP